MNKWGKLMDLATRVKLRIKQLREQKKMSVYDLAESSELTEACIRNWYTKRNYTPSLEALEKVSRALGVSVAELVRGDEEEAYPVTDDEKQLLQRWTLLTPKQREFVFMQLEILSNGK